MKSNDLNGPQSAALLLLLLGGTVGVLVCVRGAFQNDAPIILAGAAMLAAAIGCLIVLGERTERHAYNRALHTPLMMPGKLSKQDAESLRESLRAGTHEPPTLVNDPDR